MMTVAELIEKLKEFPQDLPVTTWTERNGHGFISGLEIELREATEEYEPFADHPYVGSVQFIGEYVNIG